jgi:DNA polymerase III subunit delta'
MGAQRPFWNINFSSYDYNNCMSWDVIGHEWAEKLLEGHIRRGEVRHAYLFAGAAGIGRRTLALRFAQALNCPSPVSPGQPCRKCRICQQIERAQHIDLSIAQSERPGATLKVEQIRELQRTLSLSPYEAAYRVALLLRFQEANANAQNALLKTLEEAPTRVVLFLTADSAESLLPTIASRCEILRLRPLSAAHLESVLRKRGLESGAAHLVAHVSGGRMGQALRLHEDPALLEKRTALAEDMFTLLVVSRRKRFAYAEKLAKEKDSLREAFLAWLSLWRDMMLAASGAVLPLSNPDYAGQLTRLAGALGLAETRRRASELERALARLDANLNPRLLAETTLLDWPRILSE